MNERRLNQDPERIRRRRVAAGLEAQQLARLAKISKGYLSIIERGKASASPVVLGRLADALGCTIADLMPHAPEEVKSA